MTSANVRNSCTMYNNVKHVRMTKLMLKLKGLKKLVPELFAIIAVFTVLFLGRYAQMG